MFSVLSHLNQTLLTLHIKGINLIVERNLHKYPIIVQLSPQTIIVNQFGKPHLWQIIVFKKHLVTFKHLLFNHFGQEANEIWFQEDLLVFLLGSKNHRLHV